MAIALQALGRERDALVGRRERRQGEAQRVRPPIAAAEGYAFLNLLSASASGAPGNVFFTISVNSAPWIRSSGSITFPFTLLILSPVSSTIRPESSTRRKGTSFMKCKPNIIMRATQKKRMS